MNVTGYTVYFSDRRGNRNAANNETGEYGFEDIVNPESVAGTPNGVLDEGEDVNGNGLLDTYGQTPVFSALGWTGELADAAASRARPDGGSGARGGAVEPRAIVPARAQTGERTARQYHRPWSRRGVREPGVRAGRLQRERRVRRSARCVLDYRRRRDPALQRMDRPRFIHQPAPGRRAQCEQFVVPGGRHWREGQGLSETHGRESGERHGL